jgi:transposase-like protein
MRVLNDLRSREMEDILIVCMDELTGFPEVEGNIYDGGRGSGTGCS